MKKMKKSKKIETKNCIHTVGDTYTTIPSDNDGVYIRYKCLKCGDLVKDYYELANRYNESKEKEELIPNNE